MFNHELERTNDNYYLEKGYVYLSTTPMVVNSVLGSAVSVCLYDREQGIGAINHFVRPRAESRQKATASSGNAAMVALYRMMMEAGCQAKDIVAQIFGGATHPDDPPNSLGDENVEVARNFLKKKNIRVVSEDVGGNLGRKIVFETHTGRVAVLKIEQIRKSDWH